MTRKKRESKPVKPRITAEQRKDWKALPTAEWNVLTFTEYFRGMNEECYGVPVEEYLPQRNWTYEQALIKRELTLHGPELLRAAFDECFRTHRPTREYPILTAGFAVSYRINTVIPALLGQRQREVREEQREQTDMDAVRAWL